MRKSSRLTVSLLAAVMAASLYSVDANASANVTTVLPNGGVNLSLAKAAPLESIQTEKVSATSKIEASVSLEDMVDVLAFRMRTRTKKRSFSETSLLRR